MKILCSVPILTLNSKESLQRLLPLVNEVFEDVFIVDGNSTDGTRDYAKSLGVRVEYQFESREPNQKITDFREIRMKSWAMCKYDWLFVLDSDEVPTPELIQLIRELVEKNDKSVAHSVRRTMKLPSGVVITNSPFVGGYFVRFFAQSSGVTLANRKVHERFVIPSSISHVVHDEEIICPEPDPSALRKRCRHYIDCETDSMVNTSWSYLFKWVILYNVRSFFGQLARVFISQVQNVFAGKPSLPWSYNLVFLEYRLVSITKNAKAWWRNRRNV